MAEHGLTRRLGRDLLRQAVLISVAVFISMFAAGLMIEDVLIEQALESEADYYWNRVDGGGSEQLPDTQNLTGFRPGRGEGVPVGLAGLDIGWKEETSSSSTVREVLCENGRRGQKNGRGYYTYDPETRASTPDPEVVELIKNFAVGQGIEHVVALGVPARDDQRPAAVGDDRAGDLGRHPWAEADATRRGEGERAAHQGWLHRQASGSSGSTASNAVADRGRAIIGATVSRQVA